MTFGIDRDMNDSTTGIAFSYGKSDINFDRDQKDTIKSYIASVYNTWEQGNLYVDTSLSVGSSTHESKRFSGAEASTADYHSKLFGGQAQVGYYIHQGDVMIEPMADVRMSAVSVDGYRLKRNSDGYVAETTPSDSYRKMELGMGAAVSKRFTLGTDTSIAPRLGAMFYHDFVGDQLDTRVNFAGNDYAVRGASAVQNSWEVNLSVDVMSGENFTVSAGYTRLMKSDFSSDNVNAKLKYMF